MNWPARSALIVLLVSVTGLAAAANANAAEFPARPIRLVVPYAAGGPTDILGRLMADFLGRDLGQAAFVENKSGANGAIGAETVARAEADGYTLLVVAGSMIVLNPLLYKKLSYDPVRDFRVLALITEVPVVMEVHPSVPARTVAEFVAYAKQNPGKLSFGSAGTGGTIHLAGEMFRQMAGIEMTHVPYKGAAPALTDLLAGNIQLMFELCRARRSRRAIGNVAGAGGKFGAAEFQSSGRSDHCRERLSRLPRQRLVRCRGARKGAG